MLLAARLASQVAEGAFLASVLDAVVFLPESQSTVRGFAIATALTLLPFSVLEPVAGVFVDRWPRRPILVALPLVRIAAAFLALPGIGPLAAAYAGTLVVFSANRLFSATSAAVIPRVLGPGREAGPETLGTLEPPGPDGTPRRPPDATGTPPKGTATPAQGTAPPDDGSPAGAPSGGAELFLANMIAAVTGSIALFGGVFLGGLLAAAAGTLAALTLAGVAWLAAAVLSARLSSALPPERASTGALRSRLAATAGDLADGFRRIARTPAALAPILTVAAGQFLQVLAIATALVVVRERLGAGLVTFSALVAAGGVGVFLGFATAGAMRSRMTNQALIGVAFLLSALALFPAAFVTLNAAALTLGAMLLGASYGWTRVPVDTLAQRAVPDRYRGRVFTAIDLAFNTSRVLAALAAVPVIPLLGPRTTFVLLAILFLLWAPVVPLWLARGRGPGPAAAAP